MPADTETKQAAGQLLLPGRTKIILLVAGILLLAGLLVFANLRRGSGGAGPAVSVVVAKEEPIATTVLATGRLEAADSQQVYAESGGLLISVNVKEGDRVRAGEVLASFDTSDPQLKLEQDEANVQEQEANLANLRAALAEAEVSLQQAQANLRRTTVLVEAGASPRVDLTNAQANLKNSAAHYEAAEAQIAAAKAQVQLAQVAVRTDKNDIAKSVFTADRDGTVLISRYREGDYVAPGSRLMVIGSAGQLRVKAWVDESDSAGLAPGLPVQFSCPALPDQNFQAGITLVSPAATEQNPVDGSGQTQTATGPAVEITAVPTGSVGGLRPGYTANLTITTASAAEAVVVPYDAIVKSTNQEMVFVVENGLAVARNVQTGVENDLNVQIISGVKAGEEVIEKPAPGLRDGDPVTVQRATSG